MRIPSEIQKLIIFLLFWFLHHAGAKGCMTQQNISDSISWNDINTKLIRINGRFISVQIIPTDDQKIRAYYNVNICAQSQKKLDVMREHFRCTYQKKTGQMELGWLDMDDTNEIRIGYVTAHSEMRATVRIYLPKTIATMNYEGMFGDLDMQDYPGKLNLSIDYGSLQLRNGGDIETMRVNFGSITVIHANKIDTVLVQYGNLHFKSVAEINYVHLAFGKLETISTPNIKNLLIDYSDHAILRDMKDTIRIASSFSNIHLFMPGHLDLLSLSANYGRLMMTFPDTIFYNISMTTRFGKIISSSIPITYLQAPDFSTSALIGHGIASPNFNIAGDFCDIQLKPIVIVNNPK